MRKKILFISFLETHFRELFKLAHYLQTRYNDQYNSIFLFVIDSSTNHARDIEFCKNTNTDYEVLYINNENKEKQISDVEITNCKKIKINFIKIIKLLLSNKYLLPIKKLTWLIYIFLNKQIQFLFYNSNLIKRTIDLYNQLIKNIYIIIEKIEPSLIIMAEQNVSYYTHFFTILGHKKNIGTLILPFTIITAEEFYKAFYTIELFNANSRANKKFANKNKKWIYFYKNKKIIRLPAYLSEPMELLGLSVDNPWSCNDGPADAIAVENKKMLDLYLSNGVPENKLFITGTMVDDYIYESKFKFNFIQNLYKEFKIVNKNYPLILVALPPWQWNKSEVDFKTYNELLEYWSKSLLKYKDQYTIIFCSHPRMKPEEIVYFKNICSPLLTSVNVEKLIPFCYLYIASVSATIRWAIAAGKPVLNYDCYKYNYIDYKGVVGVIHAYSRMEFEKLLQKFLSDKEYYSNICSKQEKIMNDWGMIDGSSGKRIVNLIENIISRYS
jgi:hypothetical protein